MMPNCDLPAWSLRLISELDAADQRAELVARGLSSGATELEAEIRRMERRSMPGAPRRSPSCKMESSKRQNRTHALTY